MSAEQNVSYRGAYWFADPARSLPVPTSSYTPTISEPCRFEATEQPEKTGSAKSLPYSYRTGTLWPQWRIAALVADSMPQRR
jgi:hypothetical protein